MIDDIVWEYSIEPLGTDFLLQWQVADHWANVTVLEVSDEDEQGLPLFGPDSSYSTADADVYFKGFVKWDGCCQFDFGSPHFCGLQGLQKFVGVMQHVWNRAYELMGREPGGGRWESLS